MKIHKFFFEFTTRSKGLQIISKMIIILFFISCNHNKPNLEDHVIPEFPEMENIGDIVSGFRYYLPSIEVIMIEYGLVDVRELDPTIIVELKYSTSDNFLGKDIYEGMKNAYLQPDVAKLLVRAQKFLKSIYPEFSLIVYDAARPRSIQQKMWDAVDAPFQEKIRFLANPANGSIHNFGAAVDVSIVDANGNPLDMGTGFDHMGELAYPSLEEVMLEQGKLKLVHIENRRLLRSVMRHAGFWGIQSEWWHFNACSRAEAKERYQIIE